MKHVILSDGPLVNTVREVPDTAVGLAAGRATGLWYRPTGRTVEVEVWEADRDSVDG
jgi:hypothetical protein